MRSEGRPLSSPTIIHEELIGGVGPDGQASDNRRSRRCFQLGSWPAEVISDAPRRSGARCILLFSPPLLESQVF